MNILSLVVDTLKARTPRLVLAWLLLAGLFALVFRVFGVGPLRGPELTGMLLVSAVIVAVVSWIVGRMTRSRPASNGGSAPAPSAGNDSHDANP